MGIVQLARALDPPGLRPATRRLTIARLVSLGRRNAELARSTAGITARWIKTSYKTASQFSKDWRWLRLDIDLQTRLFVEQVLWDLGPTWRKLVTGFGPIKDQVSLGRKPRTRKEWEAQREMILQQARAARKPYLERRILTQTPYSSGR